MKRLKCWTFWRSGFLSYCSRLGFTYTFGVLTLSLECVNDEFALLCVFVYAVVEEKEKLLSYAATYFFLLRTSCPSVLLKLRAKQRNRLNADQISRPLC